ncbi:MAG: hypothetical protein ACPGSM_01095 [Thiolinea sp.]
MLQLTLQAIVLTLISFSLGLLLGGWFISSRRKVTERKLQHELTGVKVNFQNAREDAHQVRSQLKQAEEQKDKLLKTLEVTSGHKEFLLVRRKLELARREIQVLKAELNRREQLIFDLKDVILTLRKHLSIRPQPQVKALNNVVRLPVVEQAEDDLQQIEGLSAGIAHQLRSLGIVSFRQIAECSPQQLANIQRLIGQGQSLPLKHWVSAAEQLFRQKYGDVVNPVSRTA